MAAERVTVHIDEDQARPLRLRADAARRSLSAEVRLVIDHDLEPRRTPATLRLQTPCSQPAANIKRPESRSSWQSRNSVHGLASPKVQLASRSTRTRAHRPLAMCPATGLAEPPAGVSPPYEWRLSPLGIRSLDGFDAGL
jgi:hypothetical protein